MVERGLVEGMRTVSKLLFCVFAWTLFLHGAPIDFDRQIKPILEEKCYRCHGDEKVKGDLRLDSPTRIMAGGENGEVLIAGQPNESSLYVLTTYPKDDPDYMPKKGKGLSRSEQVLLKSWIEEGVEFGNDFVHTPKSSVKPKFSDTDPESSRKYMILGEAVVVVAKLRESGLLVDTVNHNASLFEVNYTYADRSSGSFDFGSLVPLGNSLKKLTLARTEVGSMDLDTLAELSSIEFLDLSRTRIDDIALDAISKLVNLKYLNLRDTKVTDDGIQKLARLKHLERVYVWGSYVTIAGGKRLEKRLPGVSVIVGVPIAAPPRRNSTQN